MFQLGLDIGAARVVYGRFEYSPGPDAAELSRGMLRITARGIDVDRLAPGGEWIEEGPMAGLSQLQTRLAWRILRDLHPGPAPREAEFFSSHPPVRLDALESYARGLLAVEPEEKHRLFSLAVNLEPEFSPPIFQLGLMYWESDSYRAGREWLERVKPRDAHYLEANFLLGLCRYHLGDYSGALAAFEVVARTVPGDFVYNNIGLAQYRLGAPAALESLRWALERDPGDPDYRFNLGYLLWRGGQLEEAAEHLRAALAIDPHNAGARRLLERCEAGSPYRRGDLGSEGLERLKSAYERIREWRDKDTARRPADG
jgi:tetratricopeptide (TPR) repeat protein